MRGLAALALAFGLGSSAFAADSVTISYEPAGGDETLELVRTDVMRRGALEELRDFLAPLRLPVPIALRATTCGSNRLAYDPATHTVTICYENIARIAEIAAGAKDLDDGTKAIILNGTTIEVMLHETAFAVFDVLKVPIWGRIEDAADHFAALVMTEFGEDDANVTIRGTAMFFSLSNHTWTGAGFNSPRSPEAQRYYDFLCIAAGSDPITFNDVAEKVLPPFRAARCGEEFQKVRKAFDLRIMPYVDPDLLVKARARSW